MNDRRKWALRTFGAKSPWALFAATAPESTVELPKCIICGARTERVLKEDRTGQPEPYRRCPRCGFEREEKK